MWSQGQGLQTRGTLPAPLSLQASRPLSLSTTHHKHTHTHTHHKHTHTHTHLTHHQPPTHTTTPNTHPHTHIHTHTSTHTYTDSCDLSVEAINTVRDTTLQSSENLYSSESGPYGDVYQHYYVEPGREKD